ncbi:MCE family protein [Acidiferrimicrobium sp. IK]|uniref:MCE family protein n=1 Tax=Acidiferrimicrobium sp. IK TaxID=2871700 RepID=UPI0021CB377B|nr:MCE family protein [Acidiferrimicrobium sp. IK]MCU4187495.1 MCE family protein [Acidiferrimicrobium sp. IK]
MTVPVVFTHAQRRAVALRRRVLTASAGVAFVAVLAASVAAILVSFSGGFTDYVAVRAVIPPSQPVAVGDEVEYRQVQVGTVHNAGRPGPDGSTVIDLHLYPGRVQDLPANVVAQVAPSTLFGATAVILTSPAPVPATLAASQTIPAATAATASLQGTLQDLNNVLTGLHPAQIDTTLGALSGALAGQGPSLHDFVAQLDKYVQQMLPQLPTFESDVSLLTPVLDGLSTSVPALLELAGNASVTANTITADNNALVGLLEGASGTASAGTALFTDIQAGLHAFAVNLLPTLGALNLTPQQIPQILGSVTRWAGAWASAETDGPWINVEAPYSIGNLVDFILSGADILPPAENRALTLAASFDHLAKPPVVGAPYTAADCPRYGPEQGPNCPGSSATGVNAAASGPPSSAEQAAAVAVATNLAGGQRPASPAAAGLLLDPLLRSLAS